MTDRVAVLITQWGEPEGFDLVYRREVGARLRGRRSQSGTDPTARRDVGSFPFASSMGILPFAVSFRVEGLEGVYDSFGFYRLDEAGSAYVNVTDPSIVVPVESVPDIPGMVRPARESRHRPARSSWGQDPVTGTDHLAGIVQVGEAGAGPGPNRLAFPNGLANVDEVTVVSGLGDMRLLFGDAAPRLSDTVVHVNRRVAEVLQELFGKQVEARTGAYAETPGLMEREDRVAIDLVRGGVRRLVVTRETTDSNTYANDFMSRLFVEQALADEGLLDGVQVQQVRQVGRTPEYNTALGRNLERELEELTADEEAAVIYTTYGLPFRGSDGGGPFSTPHPWWQEVFHENSYNNFVSFKRHAEAALGPRFRLTFNRPGTASDRRLDNYFAYGLSQPADFAAMADDARFRTLRECIDLAKADGHRQIVVLLSHWVDNNRDTLVAVRALQRIPFSTSADVAAGRCAVGWTEADGDVRLRYSEAFDRVAETFALGYAHRIRGGVEMFGLLAPGVRVLARGPITRAGGGGLRVAGGPLEGAALEVQAPPDAGAPREFTADNCRPFLDPDHNMISAWDDFDAYIAEGAAPPVMDMKVAAGPLLFGPYRTIVNRPATVILPVTGIPAGATLTPRIYNDATFAWDPVLSVPGGQEPRIDSLLGQVAFDVQVLGWFVVTHER